MIPVITQSAIRAQLDAVAMCQTRAALLGLKYFWLCHGVWLSPYVRHRIESAIAEAADDVERIG